MLARSTSSVDVNKLYEALLKYYRSSSLIPWGDPRARLEEDIRRLMDQGLSREEAIKKLFEEKIGDYRVLEAAPTPARFPAGAKQVYEGDAFGIVYVELDPFFDKLPELGMLLDHIERNMGEVVALVPNVGFVSASLFLGTSFQGVKGAAVIYRRKLAQQKNQQAG